MVQIESLVFLIILPGSHQSSGGSRLSCTYPDHYCNPTAGDLIRKVEDTAVRTAEECDQLCRR